MRLVSVACVLMLIAISLTPALTYPEGLTHASVLQQNSVAYSDPSDDWYTYHRDIVRSGYDSPLSQFSSVTLHWKSVTLDGDVYTEPLIVGNAVVVGTESNSLYELNATTGQVMWHINLGRPVNGGILPCGDINPSGITGTPVVDVAGRTIFAVAFLQAANGTLYHELFAVNLDSGSIKFQVPIDPQGANPLYQQQRSALALSNGYVYVAYGGLDGDCGPYHGWLTARKTNGAGQQISYQVPTGRAGAIWGGGDGPVVDRSGNLLVATGNSDSTSTFDFGDSVMKLSPASSGHMNVLDWFAPSNWSSLNSGDLDLGSTEPVILSSNYLFQIGKQGVGYLLNATKMGHVGGQLYASQVCNSGHGAYGGLAYASPYLVVPCDNGIVVLKMNLGSSSPFTVVWRGPNYLAGPPIIAGNAVWDVDVSAGLIYAFNISSGQTLFHASIGSLPTHFNSLSAGNGQIFVTASRQVLAYLPQQMISMTVEYSVVGEGNPTAPVFNYVQGGVSHQLTLTSTLAQVNVDMGSSWSVTNPLQGSTNSERWETLNSTRGKASAGTMSFVYLHQYKLGFKSSTGGRVAPGSSWQNATASVEIQANPNPTYSFLSWIGSGPGSYTGTNNPATIIMNGPINETASFQQTSGQLSVNLISPKNGTTVTSPVTFTGNVAGLIQGANITIFVDSAKVCSTLTNSSDAFSCKGSITKIDGTHSWYAVASKTGFTQGASTVWSFKY